MKNEDKPVMPVKIRDPQTGLKSEYTGLTKRELFAAMAMQGLCANRAYASRDAISLANMSVSQAGALLKVLGDE